MDFGLAETATAAVGGAGGAWAGYMHPWMDRVREVKLRNVAVGGGVGLLLSATAIVGSDLATPPLESAWNSAHRAVVRIFNGAQQYLSGSPNSSSLRRTGVSSVQAGSQRLTVQLPRNAFAPLGR